MYVLIDQLNEMISDWHFTDWKRNEINIVYTNDLAKALIFHSEKDVEKTILLFKKRFKINLRYEEVTNESIQESIKSICMASIN